MENDYVYGNHDNIKPRQHCNYGRMDLNILGKKILADNFSLALNMLTWRRIFHENDAFDKDNPKLNQIPNFRITYLKILWKVKVKSHINFENVSFSFLKKTESKDPRNLFFGHLNINSIKLFKIP